MLQATALKGKERIGEHSRKPFQNKIAEAIQWKTDRYFLLGKLSIVNYFSSASIDSIKVTLASTICRDDTVLIVVGMAVGVGPAPCARVADTAKQECQEITHVANTK